MVPDPFQRQAPSLEPRAVLGRGPLESEQSGSRSQFSVSRVVGGGGALRDPQGGCWGARPPPPPPVGLGAWGAALMAYEHGVGGGDFSGDQIMVTVPSRVGGLNALKCCSR